MTRDTWTVITDGTRHLMGFSPTFLPGTPTVREARAIDVGVGQQIRDADFALIPGRPANISGWRSIPGGNRWPAVRLA